MSFTLKLKNVIVGRTDFEVRDPDTRTARGVFRPGLGWELIEPVYQLHADATAGNQADEALLARFRKARDSLDLAVFDANGIMIDTGPILISHDSEIAPTLTIEALVVDESFWRQRRGDGAS
jgi:hypothetical protein